MTIIKTSDNEWSIVSCPDGLCRCHWQCQVTSRSIIGICATDNRDGMLGLRFKGTHSIYTRSKDSWNHRVVGVIDGQSLTEAMEILESKIRKPVRAISAKED